MKNFTLWAAALPLALLSQAPALGQGTQGGTSLSGSRNASITPVYHHALPGIPGKSLKGVLVEYGPGGFSPSHRHAKSAIICATVLEGEVRCQINGSTVRTYRADENWADLPGDHHQVSANASATRPAKVLAVFVVDDSDGALTIRTSDRLGAQAFL
ncbi:cupin domain-containing protein [Sphingomonas sp. MAH-20]|uniref:Cupin domain-containing protein n=1 Tax=Sphingomonas horti TaxID=2682842 RepID=A0A6I4IXN6_9SPHN|nr:MULTISPECIES: cupin domain-containing protein [Sphingomonas]MBA2920871.1 cupin domain-containing protein [Sphingomonas sp. CGMCC 1.13658]MVO76857.1 cupin domain-containing protein [Sphingomonas horti]